MPSVGCHAAPHCSGGGSPWGTHPSGVRCRHRRMRTRPTRWRTTTSVTLQGHHLPRARPPIRWPPVHAERSHGPRLPPDGPATDAAALVGHGVEAAAAALRVAPLADSPGNVGHAAPAVPRRRPWAHTQGPRGMSREERG
jgi:hypothetical protein